jgi:hypothetical protein
MVRAVRRLVDATNVPGRRCRRHSPRGPCRSRSRGRSDGD